MDIPACIDVLLQWCSMYVGKFWLKVSKLCTSVLIADRLQERYEPSDAADASTDVPADAADAANDATVSATWTNGGNDIARVWTNGGNDIARDGSSGNNGRQFF